MTYDLTGKVKLVLESQTFASGFTKREVVVTVEDGKYPQDIILEFLQEKVSLLDTVSEGQEVKVFFDIRGREYNDRYFNTLVGLNIENKATVEVPSGTGEADRLAVPPEPESGDKPRLEDSVDWDNDIPLPF